MVLKVQFAGAVYLQLLFMCRTAAAAAAEALMKEGGNYLWYYIDYHTSSAGAASPAYNILIIDGEAAAREIRKSSQYAKYEKKSERAPISLLNDASSCPFSSAAVFWNTPQPIY